MAGARDTRVSLENERELVCFSFLFSLPPKKCCFLKEADLSSLTGIRPMALHWQADSLLLSHQGRFSIYSLDHMPCKTLKAALKDLSHRVGLRAK